MRTRANEHLAVKDNELAALVSRIDTLLSHLQSEWEGEAARSYADRWQGQLRPEVLRMVNGLLDDIAKALYKSADLLEETDRQISSAFKG
jgi:WXG100 family type VII secretion target